MRYKAVLQRFDSPYTVVSETDVRDECVAAAVAVYTALIPTILARGERETMTDLHDVKEYEGAESDSYKEMAATLKGGNALAAELRAREWGVGVYDTATNDAELQQGILSTPGVQYPALVYWIGATREDVKL
jgi:hypothetical protein